MPRESRTQTAILRWLRSEGFWATTIHGEPMQERGIPDILACVEGRFVAIETKRATRNDRAALSTIQRHHIEAIRAAKGEAFVATSVDDVQRLVDRLLIRIANGEA